MILLGSAALHDTLCSSGSCPKALGLGFSPVPTAGGLGSASAQWDAGAAHTALAGSKFPGTGGTRLTAAE